MKKQWSFLVSLTLITLLISACDPARVYDKSFAVEGASWDRDTVFHFEVLVDDSLAINDFFISIRNNTDYQYSNIYLFMTTDFPNGHSSRDTIECILADIDGKWLGNGSGKIKDNLIMLQQALRFPLKGIYSFHLEQAMRDEQLEGIEDIGLRIEKSSY